MFSVLVHTPVTFEPFDEPHGVTIHDKQGKTYFDSEGLSLITLAIELGRGVAAPVFAAWLYDRFVNKRGHNPAKKTKINEKLITFSSREEFIQLVEREIEQSEE